MIAVINAVYEHQNGGRYRVVAIAEHTETNEDMVVYEEYPSGKTWVRPRSMFEGEREGKPRFKRLV